MSEPIPKVAIAAQGGGSHAAFAAGVLRTLFSPPMRQRFEPIALSGTSGGAMCAALAWAGLVIGGPDDAVRRLTGFWHDVEARDPVDSSLNLWNMWFARLPVSTEVSPYLYEPLAEERLRALLATHLPLAALPADPLRRVHPQLLVAATDVLNGDRLIFSGVNLSHDHLIASAAVPPLFRAVPVDGHLCWDGLFSSNPPVREFTDPHVSLRPDEIWVIQVNPQCRKTVPTVASDIADRRNELAGNLALGQELFFIERINQLCLAHSPLGLHYKQIKIRVVEMGLHNLDYPSKMDRDPAFLHALLADGAERAAWFFDERSEWPRHGTAPAKSVSHGAGAATVHADSASG